jgi:hypothetical protein
MRHALTLVALGLAVAACARSPQGPVAPWPPPPAEITTQASAAPHDGPPRTCEDELLARAPHAERAGTIDIDGDAVDEPVFREGHDLHGNASFHFCRIEGGQPVYLGVVTAFITNVPRCAAPPTGGAPCRLSAMRRMFHDDYQENFYSSIGGHMVEVGSGRTVPPHPRPQ